MLRPSRLVQRTVMLLLAWCAIFACGSACAADHTFTWSTWGAQRDDDQLMVTFYVEVQTPMPHWELDTSIPALYLDYDSSHLVYPPAYYQNVYSGVASGFVSGKKYWAKFYKYNGTNWVFGAELWFTEP